MKCEMCEEKNKLLDRLKIMAEKTYGELSKSVDLNVKLSEIIESLRKQIDGLKMIDKD